MAIWAMAHDVLLNSLINWIIEYILWGLLRTISLWRAYNTLLFPFYSCFSFWVGANVTCFCFNSIAWFMIFLSRTKINVLYINFLWTDYLLVIFLFSEKRLNFSYV
jgi:hypothetical protein